MMRLLAWWRRLVPLCLCLGVLLTGCVDYDVGIQFSEQHQGEIVQHIRLGEQITTLSQAEANHWLTSLEQRAKQLHGYANRLSPSELEVVIPFGNGQELVTKFNQFFNPAPPPGRRKPEPDQLDLLNLKAELALEQHNWLLLDQNRLTLTVDLRALGVLSNQGNIILSPGSLINLNFDLQAPLWKAITPDNFDVAEIGETETLTGAEDGVVNTVPLVEQSFSAGQWTLQPGQLNVIETVFWVPSYLAIATIGIVVVCLGGFVLKYRRWPGVNPS